MFKKFNYNLNHTRIGAIWGISFTIILCIGFASILPEGEILPMNQLKHILLVLNLIMSFVISTYILFKGEIKPVNVTYVCPTARKYMSEQEIKEIEGEID